MAFAGYTTKAFDSDLQILSRAPAEIGELAERQVAEVIKALTTCDRESARQLVAADVAIDSIERMIEEKVVEIIARQPVVIDPRELLSILRIARELERIGDLAKNIAKRILALGAEDLTRSSMLGVRQIAVVMLGGLRDVLESFDRRDREMAVDVWVQDEDVDRLCMSLFHELVTCMTEDPGDVMSGVHLLFCTKNLERMGDLAVNIAQRSLDLMQEADIEARVDIARMTTAVSTMVRRALESFVSARAEVAQAVLEMDAIVDRMKDEAFVNLVAQMKQDPEHVRAYLDVLLIARGLERIADHATNIAEDVVYYVEGRDIRHGATKAPARAPSS
jgi:phosphate transport system protein